MQVLFVFLLCLVPHFIEAGETSLWSGPKWNEENCGVSKNPNAAGITNGPSVQVINGDKAAKNDFPWMVHMKFNKNAICGGTIISECYVLTAAHCLGSISSVGSFSLYPAENYTLFFGVHKTNETNMAPVENRVATKVIAHPDFDPLTGACDIGLIRFDKPLVFNQNIKAICKPNPAVMYLGQVGVVAGWGVSSFVGGGMLGSDSICLLYGKENIVACPVLNPKFICIKDAAPVAMAQSTCKGDSGGPLMVKEFPPEFPNGIFRQVGIISFGNQLCDVTQIQFNARLTLAVLQWIDKC